MKDVFVYIYIHVHRTYVRITRKSKVTKMWRMPYVSGLFSQKSNIYTCTSYICAYLTLPSNMIYSCTYIFMYIVHRKSKATKMRRMPYVSGSLLRKELFSQLKEQLIIGLYICRDHMENTNKCTCRVELYQTNERLGGIHVCIHKYVHVYVQIHTYVCIHIIRMYQEIRGEVGGWGRVPFSRI